MIVTKNNNIRQGFPECRGSTITYPCYAEIKLDGELNWFNNGKLYNKSGKTREKCPITDALDTKHTLIGELYYGRGQLGQLYPLLSHQDSDDLNYCVFDVLTTTTPPGLTYEERREILLNEVKESAHVSIVPTWYLEEKEQLDELKEEVWNEGFEGLVVKSPNSMYQTGPCKWVKIKKKDRNDYQVVYIDPSLERVEVLVQLPSVGYRRVGVKVVNRYKSRLKLHDSITVEHQGQLSAGGLRHPCYIPKEKGGTL